MEHSPTPVTPKRPFHRRWVLALTAFITLLACTAAVLIFSPRRTVASFRPPSMRLVGATTRGTLPEAPPQPAPGSDSLPVLHPAPPEVPVAPGPVPVLMYHEIASGPNSLYVPPALFAEQMDALQQAGFHTVTLEQIHEHFTRGKPLPPRPISLTFDDGYVSFYTAAWPAMKRHGYTGTLFMITGSAGKPGMLTWEQIRELSANGAEVQSHSVNHLDMGVLQGDRLRQELVESRRTLEEQLGKPVLFFCYPAGRYKEHTLAAVKEAGYLAAVTTESGLAAPDQNPFRWKRLRVGPNLSGKALVTWIESLQPDKP